MSGPNDRLRSAMADAGWTIEALANHLGYHRKQVSRWLNEGIAPRRPGTRTKVAALLGVEPSAIWPRTTFASAELVAVWPYRADIPRDTWHQLLTATEQLDVLVYAALFLPEQNPGLSHRLEQLAESGVRCRFLVGNPEGTSVTRRSQEEGLPAEAISVKIRNALALYRPLAEAKIINVRLHDTTLYASIYRSDDQMIVNPHLYGLPAAHAPAMHLRRLDDRGMVASYANVFDRIWDRASTPAWPDHHPAGTNR